MSGPECAGFFLPGLAHQLGNLLLTVQGNALHLQPEDAERARESLLDAVNRGGVSLSVLRAWTGETYSAPQSARALLDRLVEFARIPAREKGLAIVLRDVSASDVCVPTDSFVRVCSEAIWRAACNVPAGSEGDLVVSTQSGASGDVRVSFTFELADGSLPFPVDFLTVAEAIEPSLTTCTHPVQVSCDADTFTLTFAPISTVPGDQG